MASQDQVNVLNKIYGEYIDFKSSESTVSNYTKLAEEYEKDFVGLGYDTPEVLAKTAVELLSTNTEDTLVYDVACGTGLVADGLIKAGYKGKVDGIDGSAGMLELAKTKNIYRNLAEAFIYPDTRLDISDSTYNGIVCCGGFGPSHLEPVVLRELVRITKAGGVLVFATRYNEHATPYVARLDKVIGELVEEKKWTMKKTYNANYFDVDFCNQEKSLLATIYCYKKI